MPMTEAARDDGGHTIGASRAAAELELRRGEFALAVHLGLVQVDAGRGDGRARVRQEEIDRLRSRDGFPEALRERVRTVGTAEGAKALGISPVRFSRLARAGCLTPVAFYLNRYRAVVWLYLAQELGVLAEGSPGLLRGNSPPWMRRLLDAGRDCRPRNWRARRTELLLALTDDPWARAAVVAESLDPVQLAEVVGDPYERAYLARIRPAPVFGRGGSAAGREAMAQLMLADEPDEILWRRVTLGMELDNARELRGAPRPGERASTEPMGSPASMGAPARTEPAGSAGPAGPVGLVGLVEPAGSVGVTEPGGPAGSVGATELGGPVGSVGATELGGPAESVAETEPANPACAPSEGSEQGPRESGRPDGAGSGGGGAPRLLARLRLRRPRASRRPRPPRAAGGRSKPLVTDARTRHSLPHADQGSHH